MLITGYLSRDGMASWKQLNPQIGAIGTVVFESEDAAFIHTGTLGLARYDFAADVVTPLPRPTNVLPFPSAYRRRDGTLFSVQTPALPIYRYRGGAWTSTPYPPGAPLPLGFGANEASTLYLLATENRLLVSTDDGATWTTRTHPDLSSANLVVLPSGTAIVYQPGGGRLLRSADRGQTWQEIQPLGTAESVGTITATADGQLYLRGLRSTDEGRTWASVIDPALRLAIYPGDFAIPSGTGLLYHYLEGKGLFRSPTPATRLEYAGGLAVARSPQSTGLATMGVSAVHFSDGGIVTSNARFDPTLGQWLRTGAPGTVRRLAGNRIAAMTDNSVRFSSDGGRTWTAAVQIGETSPTLDFFPGMGHGVYELSDGRLVAAAEWQHARRPELQEEHLYTSRDNGQTWTLTRKNQDASLPLVMAVEGTTVYTYAFFSRDGGTQTGEAWGDRMPLASLPGGGVLFYTPDAPSTLKRWKNGSETTVGPVEGLGTSPRGRIAEVDAAGYAYVACGAPLVQFCKSSRRVN